MKREGGEGGGAGTMNMESCILMRSSMTLHTLDSSSGSCFWT